MTAFLPRVPGASAGRAGTAGARPGGAVILDGAALARRRRAGLRERGRAVERLRGRPPRLLLLAFEDRDGRAPWVSGKVQACREAGAEVRSLVLRHEVRTPEALDRFRSALTESPGDAAFVQFPFPPGVDGAALAAAIPREVDIDVMSPAAMDAYLGGEADEPPLTIAATLSLLDEHGIDLRGRAALVVGEATPFNRAFADALARRGADAKRVTPESTEFPDRLRACSVVVASVGRPGAIRSGALPAGAVALDVGYFNPGGAGDLDLSGGIEHLGALMPVPGGVGPMTVSMLVDAVISKAERTLPPQAG